jgi:hypothetical protein
VGISSHIDKTITLAVLFVLYLLEIENFERGSIL